MIKDFIKGIYYGIPLCCIKDYIEDCRRDLLPYEQRELQVGKDILIGKCYVPCRRCAYKEFGMRYKNEKNEHITWMIFNCPQDQMPIELQEKIKDKSREYGCCSEVVLNAIQEWLVGK